MKTVLFDLDGTLLPMDAEIFVRTYFGKLAGKMAAFGYEPQKFLAGVQTCSAAMTENDGRRTNEEVFWDCFAGIYGADIRKDEPLLADFYANEFQKVREVCGFAPEAKEIIGFLREKGARVVLATNPLFPSVAIESRIRWAGLEPGDFDLITTFENSRFCKPNPAYYREIAGKLHLDPTECIMVGNDVEEDMVAAETGMRVFLLTGCLISRKGRDITALPHGDFAALRRFLEENIAE